MSSFDVVPRPALDAPGPQPTDASGIAPGTPRSPAVERVLALRGAGLSPGVQAVLRLSGPLRGGDLRTAFARVLRRHAVPDKTLGERRVWSRSDVTTVPAPARDRVRERLMRQERRALAGAKMPVRAHLVTWAREEHDLLLTVAASAADAATLGTLADELLTAYAGVPLADDPLPYLDVVAWQAALAQEESAERGRLYWDLHRRRPDQSERALPFEHAAAAEASHESAFVEVDLRDEVGAAAGRVAEELGSSVPAFLLACWQTLFWRLDRATPVVGVTVTARKYPELWDVVGPLDRTVPFSSRVRDDLQVGAFVRAVDRSWRGAIEWQEYYDWPRDGFPPDHVYGLGFTHVTWPDGWTRGQLQARLTRPHVDVTGARLTLILCEIGPRRTLSIQFDRATFTRDAVRTLARQFALLVEHAAREPRATLDALVPMTSAEREQVLRAWNATTRVWSGAEDATLVSWMDAQAARTPAGLAVWDENGTWTYAELHAHANQIARRLQALGVGRESRVGIWLFRSRLYVAAMVGVLKAGAAYVPLDPSYPAARLAFQLADAEVSVVLTNVACAGDVPAGSHAAEVIDAADAAWRLESSAPLDERIDPSQLAYIIYTSGSTGQPKGAMNSHRGIVNRLLWLQTEHRLTPADRGLQKSSCSFDVSVCELFAPLGTGAALVLAKPDGQQDPAYLADLIARAGVTLAHFVPPMLEAFVSAGGLTSCQRVRLIVCSGEGLPGPLAARTIQAWPGELENMYGPTETAVEVSAYPCTPETVGDHLMPIGTPYANTQLYVLDAAGQPAPTGALGELHIGGVQVARGYWRRPDLTADRFVPDAFGATPGARLYRTGDLCRHRADGVLEFAGRLDHQIKLRGYRIELGEIEAALRIVPGIREAAVLLREDAPGDRRLVAYIVPAAAEAPATADVQRHLRGRLPEYMVPAFILTLDALPVTANGKVDRRRLPAPDADGAQMQGFVAPRTPVEEIVAGIWADVLHLTRVGAHDRFLSIGGDSLNAVQVLVRLREAFGREIALRTLLDHTTPATLAAELLRAERVDANEPPLVPVGRERPLPVSFGQERLWVVDRVTGSRAYHIPLAAELKGQIRPRALASAVTKLAARHEVLRTTIGVEDGRPVQIVAAPAAVRVPRVDLGALPNAMRERASHAVLHALESQPFDLRIGPLWRVTVIQLDAETHLFTCILHHIAADGWSIGVLLRDLAALYEAERTGRPADLPVLTVQYADYAAWQRSTLAAGRQAAELEYWRTRLADATPLALPTDRPRGPLPGVRGGAVLHRWDAALGHDVQAWARAQGATLSMVLVAAWQALLARYAGQTDIAVGTPVAQRPRTELEHLIGFFLNTLVLRTEVHGSASFQALVSDVRGHALGAFAHQTVPFERIIDELQPQRDLARTPFFQVMFVLQNNPDQAATLDDLGFAPLPPRDTATKYELTLQAEARSDGIEWLLQYDAALFDRSTADRMNRHLEALVRASLAVSDAPLGTLSLIGEEDRAQVQAAGRFPLAQPDVAGAPDWTLDQSLADRFQRMVKRAPDRLAVKTARVSWTYRDLNQHANRVARVLVQALLDPGRVALLCGHDEGMLPAMVGVLKAGHAYVPLDPGAPLARLRQVWADADACAIVTDAAHAGLAREIAASAPAPIVVMEELDGTPRAPKLPVGAPTDPAYVLYTSGSTGQPKGVVQNQRNVLHFIRTYTANLALRSSDRLTLLPAYGFDASVMDICGALLNGAALYPFDMRDATPQDLADWIGREQITVLHATPTVFRTLTSSLAPGRILSSVRLVVLGGEAAYRADAEQFTAHFPSTCVLVNGLGPTESTVTLQSFTAQDERLSRHALSVGYPVADTRVRLVDADGYDAEVFGEIVVESPHVAVGYWRRDDLTQAAFEDLDDGRRRYRTGDLGRLLPDGGIEFLGRKDRQVKIRGHRIELGEVETVLAEHPAVRDCVALLATDSTGAPRLVAYVVPREGQTREGQTPESQTLAARDLRRFVALRLPDHMTPSAFVPLDALPFRPNGKVDRDALPPPTFEPRREAYVAPRDAMERQIADLWRDVLRVGRVGVDDNFFELGGDSIKAIQLTTRARAAGLSLTPRLLFLYQTVAELAVNVTAAAPESASTDAPQADAAVEMTDDQLAKLASRVEFEIS